MNWLQYFSGHCFLGRIEGLFGRAASTGGLRGSGGNVAGRGCALSQTALLNGRCWLRPLISFVSVNAWVLVIFPEGVDDTREVGGSWL